MNDPTTGGLTTIASTIERYRPVPSSPVSRAGADGRTVAPEDIERTLRGNPPALGAIE